MKPPMTPHDLIKRDGTVNAESLRQHLDKLYNSLHAISVGHTVPASAPAAGTGTTITEPGMNIDGQKIVATSTAIPNTDFTINHSLGRVPVGFHYLGGSNQGVVYRGSAAWTSTTVTLRETQGTNTFTMILV